jgi:RNA polymerase sigma-70 factor (ECF subfamily)
MSAPDPRPTVSDSFRLHVELARAGSATALGQLLEACRHYLLAAAARDFDPALAAKAGPSDVVQQTFLEAHRDFHRFEGVNKAELIAWLNRILLNNLRNLRRGYAAAKRRHTRERSISGVGETFDRPSLLPSPSGEVIAREEAEVRADLLRRLGPIRERLPDELRGVLDLYLCLGPDFRAIAAELGCVEKTARRRFGRAVLRLRNELGGPPS